MPALNRWERIFGRRRPNGRVSNMYGENVLAPVFVEWLMGLPLGWVTARPLARTKQISILGAGVVPQQAEFAIRAMTGIFND